MTPGLTQVLGLYAAVVIVGIALWIVSDQDRALPVASRRRARKLFLSRLTTTQRVSWFVRRRFAAIGTSGKRYTIGAYEPFNIRANDGRYCLAVDGAIPAYDKLLAQKLLLEADESRFLALANHRPTSRFARPGSQAIRAAQPGALPSRSRTPAAPTS
jgi:hypothetical protein